MPSARLTLTADRQKVRTPSIVGVLRGEKEENVILNTHTDGQGFAEENGGVCLVHLARHFGSLPAGQRLKRSIVFSLFTGHMDPELPETQGFVNDNPTLIANAAAALTIEHFGCSEWIDETGAGYHATGQPETLGVWTTQGPMFDVTRDAVIAAGLEHTALLRPPVQFGVGGAFQTAGVPQIGAIAGPTYLVTISDNGDMDKLDERLAAKQIAWVADIMRRLEPMSKASLRQGDPTLGSTAPATPGTGGTGFMYATCAASGTPPSTSPRHASKPRLVVRIAHPGLDPHRLRITLHTTSGSLHNLWVVLTRHGHEVARLHLAEIGTRPRHLSLHRAHHEAFTAGPYALTVSEGHAVLARRQLRLHDRH